MKIGMLEKALDLRAEYDIAGRRERIVKRLYAERVARAEEPAPLFIPYHEGEHAAKAVDDAVAVFLVSVDDDLRIAPRFEDMAAGYQLFPHLGEVVYLTVVDDGDGAVLVEHGLRAVGEVDYGEPSETEGDVVAVEKVTV